MKKALFILAAIAARIHLAAIAVFTAITAIITFAVINAPSDSTVVVLLENYGTAGLAVLVVAASFVLSILIFWWWGLLKRNGMLAAFAAVVSAIAVLATADALFSQVIVESAKITIIQIIGFFGALVAFILVAIRTADFNKQVGLQTKQLKLQVGKEINNRFYSAIQLLGSTQSSSRTGAIYLLYNLARTTQRYRNQIAEVLCSHIRSITEEGAYQKQYSIMPSNEIQTAINLLFRDVNGITGLYKDETTSAGLPQADLSCSYLVGARFEKAKCQSVDLSASNCSAVAFTDSDCQGALFNFATLTGAYFPRASIQGASFHGAKCQCVNFQKAECQGADFLKAKCQGATFHGAHCQGANFSEAHCQGASFPATKCQGAYAKKTDEKEYLYSLSKKIKALSNRIGKPTEFENAIFSGEIDAESVQVVEGAKRFLEADMRRDFQNIIDTNKGKPISYEMPKDSGMVTGVLEDSERMQKTIAELKKIEEKLWR